MYVVKSKRIGLRPWLAGDVQPMTAINQDPVVMQYFPSLLDKIETVKAMQRYNSHITKYGFGMWAAEHKKDKRLMGIVGLQNIRFESHFAPGIEIGWRLGQSFWNQGFATEAALACLDFAQKQIKVGKVFAFTAVENIKSERVMQKIGMIKMGYFEHPNIDPGHPLAKHVIYQIEF